MLEIILDCRVVLASSRLELLSKLIELFVKILALLILDIQLLNGSITFTSHSFVQTLQTFDLLPPQEQHSVFHLVGLINVGAEAIRDGVLVVQPLQMILL